LAFPSEDLTVLTAGGMTNTANQTTSPDGTQNADKSTIGSTTRFYDVITDPIVVTAIGTTYTTSFFAKKGTGIESVYFFQGDGTRIAKFNLNNGAYIGHAPSNFYSAFTSYSSESFGNGWYRFTATYTATITTGQFVIGVSTNTNNSVTPISGNGTDFVYVWGLQYEASSYPTSYIPTTSASATRVADACSKTGISSLIGQTEGVIFADFNFIPHASQVIISIEDWAASSKVINIGSPSDTAISAQVFSGGNVFVANFTSAVIGQRYKCALAYKASDFAFYVNGAQVATQSSGSVPACVNFNLGKFDPSQVCDNSYNQAILFKTRLTNAELASITTL
jgi:hypothetical protein